jgi:high frequency lysogenization protein
MIKTQSNQVIALAALTQCVHVVQQIAKHGRTDEDEMRPCIASLLKVDADDVLDVYGGLSGLAPGLRLLDKQMGSPDRVDPELARYSATLWFLERKLMKSRDKMSLITSGVRTIAEKVTESGILHDDVLAELAELYQKTISEMRPRVVVMGEERYLRNSENAHRIRALLLAGIRSTVLWRQCGGSRWKILLSRSSFQRTARWLLQQQDADRPS